MGKYNCGQMIVHSLLCCHFSVIKFVASINICNCLINVAYTDVINGSTVQFDSAEDTYPSHLPVSVKS